MKTKIIARIKKSFPVESESIYREVTDFIEDSLRQLGISKELGARCVLLAEETTVQFLRAAPEGSSLQVQVRRYLGDTSVILMMTGEEFDPFDPGEEESEDSIRALLLRSAGEKYSYTN